MARKLSLWFATVMFVVSVATAADITVSPPSGEIREGDFVILEVKNLADNELVKATAEVTPAKDVQIYPAKSWGNSPVIYFRATKAGKYTITVSLNRWRSKVDEGFAAAEEAQSDPELLSDFRRVVGRYAEQYPSKFGSCVIEVKSVGPVTPPDPPQPPDPHVPTEGLKWMVVIRQTDTLTVDQAITLSNIREWSDRQPKEKVAHWEFPPDAVGPDGNADTRVKGYVELIPADKKDPYVFICQKDKSGKPIILWHGELPASADTIIAKFKEESR